MDLKQNVSLADYSTMKLGGIASFLCEVDNPNSIANAVKWAKGRNMPVIMIGTGSNIIWKDEGYPGLVIVNRIMGYRSSTDTEGKYNISAGAGESWDRVVALSVADGATGIEGLSLIPGTAGATPVQNVGAYGQEISQTLISVEAFDSSIEQYVTLANKDCEFAYRSSRFNGKDRGRYFITKINLQLRIGNPIPPFYPALQSYLKTYGFTEYTPKIIRDAVIVIRRQKLPDPTLIANNGSFFGNPIISKTALSELLQEYPDIVYWPMDDGNVKVSAAWLVEKAGFKDVHDPETGMGTWQSHALILVNEHAKHTADLLKFRQKVTEAVKALSGIDLKQEPELLP